VKTKIIFILTGLLLLVVPGVLSELSAQEKVIDKSGKKPDWVSGIEPNYLIESGKGATLDEAKTQALTRVKDNIVNSVAVKVSSSTELSTSEIRQGEKYNVSGSYAEVIKTKTANLPAIKGISENKVSEFYWEKIQNKKSGLVVCYYHVKYPFSQADLDQIIFEYNEALRRMREQLEAAIAGLDDLTQVEAIIERLTTLRHLSKQLEDENKAIAATNIGKLEDLLKNLQIQQTVCEQGALKYFLVYGNRRFTTSQNPKTKSNCASNFRQQSVGDTMEVRYDHQGCRSQVTNTISLEYRFESRPVKAEFQLASTFTSSNLKISEGAQFVIIEQDYTTITQYKIVLPVLMQSNETVELKNVTITFSKRPMLTFNNVSGQTLSPGLNSLELTGDFPLQKSNYTFENYEIVLISGSITYTNLKTNSTSAYKFYNEKVAVMGQ
jgi:hypothetical protein